MCCSHISLPIWDNTAHTGLVSFSRGSRFPVELMQIKCSLHEDIYVANSKIKYLLIILQDILLSIIINWKAHCNKSSYVIM